MSSESKGANGNIQLYYDGHESASGHHESWKEANLKCKDLSTILLVEENGELGMYKGMKRYRKIKKYEISVSDLVKLIRENGNYIGEENLPPISF